MKESQQSPGQRWERFRQQRLESLRSPKSFLALSSSDPITEAGERVEGVAATFSPAPSGSGLLMTWEGAGDSALPLRGDAPIPKGVATLLPDRKQPGFAWVRLPDGRQLTVENSNMLRVWDPQSSSMREFSHMDVYAYNPSLVFNARLESAPQDITYDHVQGTREEHRILGDVVFSAEAEGQPRELRIQALDYSKHMQLVIADLTTGKETYAPARFLFLPPAGSYGRIRLDFNYLLVPPCGFSPYFNCPLAPAQNRLPLALTAGERFPVTS